MPHEPNTKLKVPHTTTDIQALEDQLSRIAQELRDIRNGMAERQIPEIELKAGTFKHYLAFLQNNVKDFKSEFEKAVVKAQVSEARDRKQKELKERTKSTRR